MRCGDESQRSSLHSRRARVGCRVGPQRSLRDSPPPAKRETARESENRARGMASGLQSYRCARTVQARGGSAPTATSDSCHERQVSRRWFAGRFPARFHCFPFAGVQASGPGEGPHHRPRSRPPLASDEAEYEELRRLDHKFDGGVLLDSSDCPALIEAVLDCIHGDGQYGQADIDEFCEGAFGEINPDESVLRGFIEGALRPPGTVGSSSWSAPRVAPPPAPKVAVVSSTSPTSWTGSSGWTRIDRAETAVWQKPGAQLGAAPWLTASVALLLARHVPRCARTRARHQVGKKLLEHLQRSSLHKSWQTRLLKGRQSQLFLRNRGCRNPVNSPRGGDDVSLQIAIVTAPSQPASAAERESSVTPLLTSPRSPRRRVADPETRKLFRGK